MDSYPTCSVYVLGVFTFVLGRGIIAILCFNILHSDSYEVAVDAPPEYQTYVSESSLYHGKITRNWRWTPLLQYGRRPIASRFDSSD